MTGSAGTTRSDGAAGRARSYCAFWAGGECYGLEIDLVGELTSVEALLPVPLSPPAVLGLFSLRGTPVALVNLGMLLDLPAARGREPQAARSALVLRTRDIQAGMLIERMETVLSSDRGVLRTPEGGTGSSLVEGFFETDQRGGLLLRVLDGAALLERLSMLKLRDRGAEGAPRRTDSMTSDISKGVQG